MAQVIKKKFVLRGPHSGKDIDIGGMDKYPFRGGELIVSGSSEDLEKYAAYFSYWGAEMVDIDHPPAASRKRAE
jgi:hypothetical protein